MNWGDHLIHALAVKAGATYGQEVIKAGTEFIDASDGDRWAMEVWSRFEVEVEGGGFNVHYLAGSLTENLANLVYETITIPLKE